MRLQPLIIALSLFLTFGVTDSIAQTIKINTSRAKDTYELGATRISRHEVKELISVDETAWRKFKTGEALGITGIVTCAAGGHLLAAGVGLAVDNSVKNEELSASEQKDNSLAWTLVGSGIGALVPGALMMILGKEQRVKGVKKYNETVGGSAYRPSIKLKPASRGIGVALVF